MIAYFSTIPTPIVSFGRRLLTRGALTRMSSIPSTPDSNQQFDIGSDSNLSFGRRLLTRDAFSHSVQHFDIGPPDSNRHLDIGQTPCVICGHESSVNPQEPRLYASPPRSLPEIACWLFPHADFVNYGVGQVRVSCPSENGPRLVRSRIVGVWLPNLKTCLRTRPSIPSSVSAHRTMPSKQLKPAQIVTCFLFGCCRGILSGSVRTSLSINRRF